MFPNNSENQRFSPSYFQFIRDFRDSLEDHGLVPERVMKKVAWVFLLACAYIWVQHNSDKLVVRLEKDRIEMKEVRASYISHKAEYMFSSKHSEITRKIGEKRGLDNMEPPVKITIED